MEPGAAAADSGSFCTIQRRPRPQPARHRLPRLRPAPVGPMKMPYSPSASAAWSQARDRRGHGRERSTRDPTGG